MFETMDKTEWKVLNVFLDNPYISFYLRDIAKKVNISPSSAKKAIDKLEEESLLKTTRYGNLRIIYAKKEETFFKLLKVTKNIKFIQPITKKLTPAISIMLYGSYAKGENDETSDIDIAVISNKKFTLREYKKHQVELTNITPQEWSKMKKNNPAYAREVMRGILLYGEELQ